MESVRWGLIGCGDIAAKRVASALAATPGSRLMAVSRRQADRAEEFARRFGVPSWHASWQDLVRDPALDAVYVATPVSLHAAMTIAAADAGKHVLCEKPMALDVTECDRMLDAARRNGVRLGIAYYRRFYPILRRVRQLIEEDAIGRVVGARAEAFEAFDPGPDHPRRWLLAKSQSGGGPMFDFGCHRLELLLGLLGPVAEARGACANAAFAREVEDTAVGLLRFASGALATVAVTHATGEARDTLEIVGRRGWLHVPKLNGSALRVRVDGDERVEQHPAPDNLHQPLVADFVEALRQGRPPLVDGAVGREVNRLLACICD